MYYLYQYPHEGIVDKQRMEKDVHNTLIDVIEKEGAMTHEAAEAYLNDIQKQGRYQRDVY